MRGVINCASEPTARLSAIIYGKGFLASWLISQSMETAFGSVYEVECYDPSAFILFGALCG